MLREGDDVTIIAIGTLVSRALDAADMLQADGISARVLNMPFVDPLDVTAILDAAGGTRGIMTAEEGSVTGGLGAAVASLVAPASPGADAHPGHRRVRAHRQHELLARPLRPQRRRHRSRRA